MRERVERLFARGVAAGIGQRIAHAFRYIEGRLELSPTSWGELIFRLNHARLDVYQHIHDGLYVVFTIHEEKRQVWLTRVYPISGHPLHDPNEEPG